ncbi:hypothetical protein WANG_0790 [Lactobacillus kefiranofaciens subsp. kefiranofaciens]|nr:hypothetical protein WANG_0790 [Lactobacillus kefiranofaciens subsp. kefiranofaciens]
MRNAPKPIINAIKIPHFFINFKINTFFSLDPEIFYHKQKGQNCLL